MFELLNTIDAFVWGPAMIALLLGSHLFFTFKTGFIQRKLPQAIKLSLSSDPEGKGDISHFGALATALAATIGMSAAIFIVQRVLNGALSAAPGTMLDKLITLACIGVAVVVYAVLLLALGAVERDDVLLLPKGEKIADILHLK